MKKTLVPAPSEAKEVAEDNNGEYYRITLYLGIDVDDPIFDATGANKRMKRSIHELFNTDSTIAQQYEMNLKVVRLDPQHSGGKIAHIWNELAARAYTSGTHYFITLSDDAVLQSQGWLPVVISKLRRNNNFGMVSLYEVHKIAAPGTWPTFPCYHRTHIDIFTYSTGQQSIPTMISGSTRNSLSGNILLPFDPTFMNSFADIWLADVYSIFPGAASIEPMAVVHNVVGGEERPRYAPTFPGWDTYVDSVQRARRRVAAYLSVLSEGSGDDNSGGGHRFPHSIVQQLQQEYQQQQQEHGQERSTVTMTSSIDGSSSTSSRSSRGYRYTWTPQSLSYGPEGYHYEDYCKQAPGCKL